MNHASSAGPQAVYLLSAPAELRILASSSLSTSFVPPQTGIQAGFTLDAAQGGLRALASSQPSAKGSYWSLADSVAWDPHKTMFVTYPAGVLVIRDKADLWPLEATADYAFHDPAQSDPGLRHLEGSRGFDALKIWATIRHIGADGYRPWRAGGLGVSLPPPYLR